MANSGSFRTGDGRTRKKKGDVGHVTKSMREAFKEAFDQMGGVDALVEWGTKKPDLFYPLASKLIPIDITTGGEKISVTINAPGGGSKS